MYAPWEGAECPHPDWTEIFKGILRTLGKIIDMQNNLGEIRYISAEVIPNKTKKEILEKLQFIHEGGRFFTIRSKR